LKFRTNAYTYSFHLGGLLKKNIIFSVSLLSNFPYIDSFTSSVSAHSSSYPSLFTIGIKTFILLGPFDPKTFVSYYTTAYYLLDSALFYDFLGLSLLSKTQNSVPKKFERTFPK
jgi:hypothetical protein